MTQRKRTGSRQQRPYRVPNLSKNEPFRRRDCFRKGSAIKIQQQFSLRSLRPGQKNETLRRMEGSEAAGMSYRQRIQLIIFRVKHFPLALTTPSWFSVAAICASV